MKEVKIRRLAATEERQYMMNEKYEVYEKLGVPLGAISFHYHSFYEIIYVMEGEFSSMTENQTYYLKKGDFLLIDRNVMHKYHFNEKHNHDTSKRIILWITGDMLKSLSEDGVDLSACFSHRDCCAYHFPIYYEELLRSYLLKVAMQDVHDIDLPGAKSVLDRAYLTLFFLYINALRNREKYLFTAVDMITHELVSQVSSYIDEHLSENIRVNDLAEHVHMSKYHFLRKFKELTGVTAHTFITDKRLIRACEEIQKGVSITQACQNTGFNNYSSFLRNFKKNFGISPGKYNEAMGPAIFKTE